MPDLELILTGPAAQDAARDLAAALAFSGLQPRPLEDADAVLAVMDITERIADRTVRRRRARALVETAARLGSERKVEILVRTADGTRALAEIDPDALLALVESPSAFSEGFSSSG